MANQVIVVRDVTFNWPKLVDKHSPFGTLQWDVQVVTSNDATKAHLESAGVKMKSGDNGYYANINVKQLKLTERLTSHLKLLTLIKKRWHPARLKLWVTDLKVILNYSPTTGRWLVRKEYQLCW